MRRYNTVPDFTADVESLATALRVMKDIVEQLAGLRQGGSLGAPAIYVQGASPRATNGAFRLGDLWISGEVNAQGVVTSSGILYYWDGSQWKPLTAGNP